MLRVLPPAENLSSTRIVPSRYLSVFWAERRLGIRLRRVIFPSSLPMRPHVFPRAPQPNPQSSLTPKNTQIATGYESGLAPNQVVDRW